MTTPNHSHNHSGRLSSKWQDIRDIEIAQFEERAVRYLLTRFRIPPRLREEMRMMARERYGEERLTFQVFRAVTGFPAWLKATKMPGLSKSATIARLLSSAKAPFLKAYENALDGFGDLDQIVPCGLVFPWPHLKSSTGAVALHNRHTVHSVSGTRIVFSAMPAQRLCICDVTSTRASAEAITCDCTLTLTRFEVFVDEIAADGFAPADVQ